MKKLSDLLNAFAERLCFVALLAMVVVITLQVVCRLYFTALSWSEELGRYLLVWITFFGASVGFKRGSHMAVTALVELFPPSVRTALRRTSVILCALFFLVMVVYGLRLMQLQHAQTSPSLNIPMSVVYAALPASGTIMLVHSAAMLQQMFQKGSETP